MFSNETGLSKEEVEKRQKQYGKNILPEKPPPSRVYIFIQQLKNPFVYILLLATIATLLIGHASDALIISIAVLINTILGFLQESKASRALYALKNYITRKAIVIREGKRIEIDAIDIVPGDLVVLGQGAKIPADGKLTFANRLYVDEAVLTGESLPVGKNQDDAVFTGTIVSSGQAVFLVEAIGKNTKVGKIALQIQEREDDTPLQRQLKKFSKQLVITISALTFLVFVLGVFHKLSLVEIFTTSVALAVSSLPEGLLISLTIVLAIGMQKIIKHRGLVRKLSAAETLGGVSIICVDKTGTLTQGKMVVVDYIGDKETIAQQVLIANDLDDPIVISAFEWGRTVIQNSPSGNTRIDSIPFSSKERFFVSLHKWTDAKNMVFVNGAPEILLGWTDLASGQKQEIIDTIGTLTKQGKRILGFARKETPGDKKKLETTDAKKGLTWVGLLAFSDPVRPGVSEALAEAREAGIKITVITGDYPSTSEFVLSELGISVQKNEILTGQELAELTVEELSQKAKTIKLFARTTPDQKFMIVEALKKTGEIVAMMGDGVNDAPALHKADIGIVVADASDVAKESADLVLLDSNFATIIKSVEEGRVIFDNIRKIILYLMSDAFAEIILVVGGILLGLPLPVTAIQILWVNLVSDSLPNMALTIDPKRTDIMKEKPRPFGEKLVTPWMIELIAIVSLVAGLAAFASFFIVYKLTEDSVLAQSVAFVTLGFDSLIYVFSVRTLTAPFWKTNFFENKWLIGAVVFGFGLQVLPFTSPFLREFFGLERLIPIYWISALTVSALMFVIIEVFKVGYRLSRYKYVYMK